MMMQHEDILTTEITERVGAKLLGGHIVSSYSGQCSDGTYHFHRSLHLIIMKERRESHSFLR